MVARRDRPLVFHYCLPGSIHSLYSEHTYIKPLFLTSIIPQHRSHHSNEHNMAQTESPQSIIGVLLQPQVAPFFIIAVIFTLVKILNRTDGEYAQCLQSTSI